MLLGDAHHSFVFLLSFVADGKAGPVTHRRGIARGEEGLDARTLRISSETSLPAAILWLSRVKSGSGWCSVVSSQASLAVAMTDRYTIHSQLEHLQSKYIGTGHADTTKWEWLVNQHRDSYCSYMGHFDLLNYFAIAENESKARVRFNLMEKMLQPCGPPADKPEES
nr:splicing factor 3B subunit 5 [Chelonoidis abingdonii]